MNLIIDEEKLDFDYYIREIGKYGIEGYNYILTLDFLLYIVNNFKNFNKKTKDIIRNKIICNFEKSLYNTSYSYGSNILCDMIELLLFHIVHEKHNFTPSYLLNQNTRYFINNLSWNLELLKILNFKYNDYLFKTRGENVLYYIIKKCSIDSLKYIDKKIKFKRSDILNINYLYRNVWKKFIIEFNNYCNFDLLTHVENVKYELSNRQIKVCNIKYGNINNYSKHIRDFAK